MVECTLTVRYRGKTTRNSALVGDDMDDSVGDSQTGSTSRFPDSESDPLQFFFPAMAAYCCLLLRPESDFDAKLPHLLRIGASRAAQC